jgi:hypothetical protein
MENRFLLAKINMFASIALKFLELVKFTSLFISIKDNNYHLFLLIMLIQINTS